MKKKWIVFVLALVISLSPFAGTLLRAEGEVDLAAVGKVKVFNTKGENAAAMDAAAAAYNAEKGTQVEVFSLGAGTDSSEVLNQEMASSEPPTVFSIMNMQDLRGWQEGGYAYNLSEIENEEFKALVDSVPEGNWLTTDGEANYGIPYNVEGYGYIFDTLLFAEIFGEDNVDAVIEAVREASYDEWEALVLALDAWIAEPSEVEVTLSGETFTLAPEKGDLSSNLTGVFATAGSQQWTYGDHMLNVALNAVFNSPAAAAEASDEEIASLKDPFTRYAQALDLKTSHAAGLNGALPRSPEFINQTTASYDMSVQLLADHKGIFLKQGNWVYTNIENVNDEIVETLYFLPVKMPMTQEDIKVDLTPEEFNASIPVFVPNYYALNAKVSDEERAVGMDFLVWLNTSEAGLKYVTEDMAFIPYNADTETTINNSLGQSIIDYIAAGKTISNPYAGAPTNWSGETMGRWIMENYLTVEEWSDTAYEDIADEAVNQWMEMKQ